MSINDFVLAETKNGPRIHRDTCPRKPETAQPLEKVIEFAPGTAARATPSGCCKPKGALAYTEDLDQPTTAVPLDEKVVFTPYLPDPEEDAADIAACDQAKAEDDGTSVSLEEFKDGLEPLRYDHGVQAGTEEHSIPVAYSLMDKKFWTVCRDGALQMAEAHGVSATADSKTLTVTLTGTGAQPSRTAYAITQLWTDVGNAFRDYKKGDEAYRVFRKENGICSALVNMERNWLRGYFTDRVAEDLL